MINAEVERRLAAELAKLREAGTDREYNDAD